MLVSNTKSLTAILETCNGLRRSELVSYSSPRAFFGDYGLGKEKIDYYRPAQE
jgi:hypothetical protein